MKRYRMKLGSTDVGSYVEDGDAGTFTLNPPGAPAGGWPIDSPATRPASYPTGEARDRIKAAGLTLADDPN